MKIDANIERIKSDLKAKLDSAQTHRTSDKNKSAIVAVYMGVASAVTTICIGMVSFIPDFSNVFGITALVTSASVTVLAAWDGIFHHKKLWINSSITINELYELSSDIHHMEESTDGISQEHVNELYGRYKQIVRDTNDRWYKIRE